MAAAATVETMELDEPSIEQGEATGASEQGAAAASRQRDEEAQEEAVQRLAALERESHLIAARLALAELDDAIQREKEEERYREGRRR